MRTATTAVHITAGIRMEATASSVRSSSRSSGFSYSTNTNHKGTKTQPERFVFLVPLWLILQRESSAADGLHATGIDSFTRSTLDKLRSDAKDAVDVFESTKSVCT